MKRRKKQSQSWRKEIPSHRLCVARYPLEVLVAAYEDLQGRRMKGLAWHEVNWIKARLEALCELVHGRAEKPVKEDVVLGPKRKEKKAKQWEFDL